MGFEDLTEESIERLKKLSQSFSMEQLLVMAQTLTQAAELMRRVEEPRVPLEIALIRLSNGGLLASVPELIQRLERLTQGQPAAAPVQAAAPIRAAAPVPAAPVRPELVEGRPSAKPVDPSLQQAINLWPQFMQTVQQQKVATAAYLSNAAPVSVQENGAKEPVSVVIGFLKGSEFNMNTLSQTATRQWLSQVWSALMGRPVNCMFEIAESLPAVAGYSAAPVRPEPVEGRPSAQSVAAKPADPGYIQSVLELFDGRMLSGEGS
jgi:DNA polymerase III gamma/tau subunit